MQPNNSNDPGMNPQGFAPMGQPYQNQMPPQVPSGPLGPNNIPVKKSRAWMIVGIIFIVLTVGLAGFGTWAFMGYLEYKGDTDTKINTAVAEAKKQQADELEAEFNEREKEPNRTFVGPDDYGGVTFDYPKTWSVSVYNEADKGNYEAYLNPVSVPPVTKTTQVSLRVNIESRDYDRVVSSYESLVQKGSLKSSIVTVGDHRGTRLDGLFNDNIRGAAVIFKIRDKTLTLRTDANTFLKDFNALVKSMSFNQ